MTGGSILVGVLCPDAGVVMIVVVRVSGSTTGLRMIVRRRVVVALGGGSLQHERRGRDEHEAQRDHPGKGA